MAREIAVLYHDENSNKWLRLLNRGANPDHNSTTFLNGTNIADSNKPFAYNSGNPVQTCSISESMGIPMEMELSVNNRQGAPTDLFEEPVSGQTFGTDPLVNNQIGQFHGLLLELTFLYVYEVQTYMPLFQGRIHLREEQLQGPYGSNLLLTCRDALEDLAQGTLGHLQETPNDTAKVDRLLRDELLMTTTAGDNGTAANSSGDDKDIYKVGKRAYILRDLVDKSIYAGGTANAPLLTDQANKFKAADSKTFVAKDIVDNNRWKHSEHVNGSPLSTFQYIAKSDTFVTSGKTHYGFGFYSDITRLTSLRSTGRRAQDLAYFRAGYEPTDTPSSYGLTVEYATSSSIHEFPSSSSSSLFGTEVTVQKRNMFSDFKFGMLASEVWTHVLLRHRGKANQIDDMTVKTESLDWGFTDDTPTTPAVAKAKSQGISTREDLFTSIYVDAVGEGSSPFNGTTFTVDTDNNSRSFSMVSSLHNHATNRNFTSPNKTWLGNVQFCSGTGDGQFIVLSEPQDDTIKALQVSKEAGGTPLLYENRGASGNAVRCEFVSAPSAQHRMRKVKYVESLGHFTDNYQSLREGIADALGKSNRLGEASTKGLFNIEDWPSVKWVGTAQSGSSTNTLVPQGMGGVDSLTPLDYGIKRGASVTSMDSGYLYVGNIVSTADANVSVAMFREDKLDLDTTTAENFRKNWATDSPYSIHLPTRVGHVIHVKNNIVAINGEHLVTKIDYSFSFGLVKTQIETMALNNDFSYAAANSLGAKDGEDGYNKTLGNKNPYSELMTASKSYTVTGMLWWHAHAVGATPALAAAGKRDYNTFSWSGGKIRTHIDGKTWIINPGDTDAALTTAGYTSPMEANIQYVVYLDRSRPAIDGKHSFEIDQVTHDDNGYVRLNDFVEVAYMTIGKNEDAGKKTIGIPGSSYYSVTVEFPNGQPNVEFLHAFDNVHGTNKLMMEADRFINNEGLSSSLMRKGAGRPWTSNLDVQGTAYNAVEWDNGTDSTNATLTFGNGDVVTLVAGNATSLAAGTHYLYIDGSSAGLTGNLTPTTTTSHATSIGDNKLLLALITVGASTDGSAPTIVPFNSKQMTINANVIAANAVIAEHVQAGTLTTNKFTSSAQTDILNSNSDRAKTFAQNGIPTAVTIGDLWVDTNDGNKMYRAESVGANEITSGEWVKVNDNAPSGEGNKIFRQSGIPTSLNIGDIWTDTDDQAIYFALSVGADAIVTSGSTGWMRRDDVLAINAASTSIDGGLINSARIILKEGGASTAGLFMTAAATFSPANDQSYIQMDHTSIKGVSRTGTTDTTQFEIKADTGRAEFGAGKVIANSSGLAITSTDSANGFISLKNSSGTIQAFLMSATSASWDRVQLGTADGTDVYIGMDDQAPGPARISTPTIHLVSRYLNIPGNAVDTPKIYSMPTDNPIAGDVLACNSVTTGIVSPNTSTHNIYNLHWTPVSGGSGDITAVLAGDGIAVSGGSSGDATVSIAQGFDPVWTGTHAWTGTATFGNTVAVNAAATFGNTVNVNAKTQLNQDVDIGDSNADTVLIKAKVGGGSFGAPGITFSNDTGFWTNASDRIFWTANSQTSGHGYLKSDGTYDTIGVNTVSSGATYADNFYGSDDGSTSDVTHTWTGKVNSGMYYDSGVSFAVAGTRRLQLQSNGAYVTGYLNVDTLPVGTATDVTWYSVDEYFYKASSTRASKMNIRDLDIDTSKLYDLELKSFDFRKTDMDTGLFLDEPHQASFGMIAEDVHTILPDLVNLDKDGEPEAVHYKLISVLLLSELKKLKARIEVLEGD